MSAYSAFAIANFFLHLAEETGAKITPLKIQKLVYISHGYHLAFTERDKEEAQPLVYDENAEAWEYGPVFPSLYHEFKHFGKNPITEPAQDVKFFPVSGKIHRIVVTPEIDESDEFVKALLRKIWEVYGEFSGIDLSAITHKRGSPWYKTRKKEKLLRNTHIHNKEIKKYYLERIT